MSPNVTNEEIRKKKPETKSQAAEREQSFLPLVLGEADRQESGRPEWILTDHTDQMSQKASVLILFPAQKKMLLSGASSENSTQQILPY